MAKTSWLIEQLKASKDNPLNFTKGTTFGWDYSTHTVTYDPSRRKCDAYLLHEVGHAILGHQGYQTDTQLLEMERAAWDKARELADMYQIIIDDSDIEESLDTYRDWLHSRSLCPHCNSTGLQAASNHYRCAACQHEWRVNEARTCALRRYSTKKRSR
ncbi:hypothetical protein L336_0699 [Candidatus Saccharimonas aalborgensis]|jgi:hypothetical protein|uniref:IrrE N-terminal-like domain-containing protein n=1 Tax=Candidatus Saccharimonas aalborgensis TaxID=1332188 RepID=R4PYT7_9BACT|nr:hypothetical protein [Candidatus Saccharimonas aalborgensis]AGL62401.1 hypothetical protein L336_0699 [Candidatus Saccharimonas aalborgensis]QQR51151.1 MAG: hypothetical protein IPF89_05390 [Candidatus Saccharibacteria bacterium]QQS67904.1 MAG: hypothetical protein IPP24_02705 [Candidatus Saccharibacteria bacterium]QQS70244.1 MAG: hypothetical protein IPP92_02830 [Candidatus Saccharibacteria bacterium]